MNRILVALTVASAVVAGCSTTQSSDVRTSGLEATMRVTLAEGSSAADVAVTLQVGSLTFVELREPDGLVARSGERSVVLVKERVLGHTSYHGRLDGVTEPGAEVVIALRRGEDDESAARSFVRLPGRFAVTSPPTGARFSRRTDDITFRLDRPLTSGGQLTWDGNCVMPESAGLTIPPGASTVTVSKGTIQAAAQPASRSPQQPPVPKTCTVHFAVKTSVPGTLDPAFGEGTITAEAVSNRDLTLSP